MSTDLPKSLLDHRGMPKRPPAKVRHLFACPVCGCLLERTARFWVCPVGLDHTRLISDRTMLARLKRAMRGYRRWTALGILRTQLRVRRRLGVRLQPQRERERGKPALY